MDLNTDKFVELNAKKLVSQAVKQARDFAREKPLVAEMILKQALRCDPENIDALCLLGLVLHHIKKNIECIEVLQVAIELNPDNPDNYNNVSLAYGGLEQFDKAIEYSKKAVEIDPSNSIFHNNLAIHYRQSGKSEEAIESLRRALSLKETAPIWANLGGIYGDKKNLVEAEKCFLRAIQVDPDCAGAHVDLAFTYHLMGRYQEGFKEYEWRTEHFGQMKLYKDSYDQKKRWISPDQDIKNKTVILYSEQGLGDFIMALRWIPLLKERGVREIIIHCSPVVNSLALMAGADCVVNRDIGTNQGEEFPEYDLQCCILSLPYLLQYFDICGKPYLDIPPTDIRTKYPSTFNIGLCWAGSPAHPGDAFRSVYLRQFRPLSEIPGVKLFSLQKDIRPRMRIGSKEAIDLTEGCDGMQLVDMSSHMSTFKDTSSVVGGLDLVISVDTAIVHACGAVGAKCWALIPHNPDWRWGVDGETTVWYDSVRLIRQKERGKWNEVIEGVAQQIKEAQG